MNTVTIRESNYSVDKSNCNVFQFKLPLDFYTTVPVGDQVTSFVEIMKGIDTSKYFNDVPHRGNQGYDPHMMLRVVLFAFMNEVPSLRELEELCRYDIRYMWMVDNQTPSFMAFQRFISHTLSASIKDIFYDICKRLIELDHIDTSILYIDGTKLEANARKNSFVWKKAILSNSTKLYEKVRTCLESLNALTGTSYIVKTTYSSYELGSICDHLIERLTEYGIEICYGKGKKKHFLQKKYDEMLEYFLKLKQYEEMLEICGDRNSYSKTDRDATMMNMKYDYYNRTGVFKPGYNLQIGVSDGYVLHAGIFPNPTDTKTFIPFMEDYREAYGYLPRWPIGDAGYGSYDNYMYCIINRMELGMKYNYYGKKNEAEFKKKTYHSQNFRTNENGNKVCPQGHEFNILKNEKYNEEGKYLQIIRTYGCGKCEGCPVRDKCTTSETGRHVQINPILNEMQEKVDENLSTKEGKEMKKQRCIQAEGVFGEIKQDYEYVKIRRRGNENVLTEILLVLIGHNLRKYHNKKDNKVN